VKQEKEEAQCHLFRSTSQKGRCCHNKCLL